MSYTGGLQGTGDTRSPLYISIVSQVVIPLGLCSAFQATRGLQPADIWMAIVIGHFTRALLSVMRFRQQKWRSIAGGHRTRAGRQIRAGHQREATRRRITVVSHSVWRSPAFRSVPPPDQRPQLGPTCRAPPNARS